MMANWQYLAVRLFPIDCSRSFGVPQLSLAMNGKEAEAEGEKKIKMREYICSLVDIGEEQEPESCRQKQFPGANPSTSSASPAHFPISPIISPTYLGQTLPSVIPFVLTSFPTTDSGWPTKRIVGQRKEARESPKTLYMASLLHDAHSSNSTASKFVIGRSEEGLLHP